MEEQSIAEVFGEKSKDSDELIAHTLQAIANMKRGESEDILYKAMTKGGDPRYIHRNIRGLPTGERREWSANMLRSAIEQDPTFADTLSREAGMERLAPQKSIMSRFMKALFPFPLSEGQVKEYTSQVGDIERDVISDRMEDPGRTYDSIGDPDITDIVRLIDFIESFKGEGRTSRRERVEEASQPKTWDKYQAPWNKKWMEGGFE